MHTRLPDANAICFPGFRWTNSTGLRRYIGYVSAAAGASVLEDGNGMQIDDARRKFAIFFRGGRIIFILTFSTNRIVESPMLGISLTSLHRCAPDLIIRLRIRF